MNEMTQTAKQMKQTVEELDQLVSHLKLNSHSKDIPLPRGIFFELISCTLCIYPL